MSERLLTTQEAAEFLGLSPHTLEQYRWLGTGPKFRKNPGVRGAVRYRKRDLLEWMGQPRVSTKKEIATA